MSLLHIDIRDFVIVDHLSLELSDGFTALTGETGAGKSILIDALQFALGGRVDASIIRPQQSRTEVSVQLDATPPVQKWLDEQAWPHDSNEPLVLRRVMDMQGKSRAWVNGQSATLTQLRELGQWLVDIHGQHAWQALMRADSVRDLLDAYGQIDTQPTQEAWRNWRQALAKLEQARHLQTHAESQRDALRWQLDEFAQLQPGPQEWDSLTAEHNRLAHVQTLLEATDAARQALSEDEANARSLIVKTSALLRQRAHLDAALGRCADTLDQAAELVQETLRDLNAAARHFDEDPDRLTQVEQRMGQWMSLTRKHRCDPEQLHALWLERQAEWDALDASADLGELERSVQQAESQYQRTAKALSQQRAKAARQLAQEVTQAMQELGMVGGRLAIELCPLNLPQAHGLEGVEFLVAGHAGTEPRPIQKVASGGELSRISLAIAVCTSQVGTCPTLLFDEVDSGIGGPTAHKVGKLMAQLGAHRQVLAVTHLPQVAACAHQHLRVSKAQQGQAVISQVALLPHSLRIEEIARMLGGEQLTPTTLAHAKELLELA